MRRFLTCLRPYRARIALIEALLITQAIANLYLPDLNAEIINEGVAKGDTAFIWRTGGLMVGVTFALAVAAIIATYHAVRTAMGVGRDLRSAIFRQVQAFSAAELDRFGTASLITRNTNDVQQVQMALLLSLTMVFLAPVTAVGAIVMAMRQDLPLSTMFVVVLPLMAIIIGLAMRTALPLFRGMQAKTDRVQRIVREKLAGARVIRAFVRGEYEERRFDEANRDLTTTALRIQRLFAMILPTLMAIFNLTTVAILWFGGKRVDAGAMPIGNLTAFMAYMMQVLFSVMMATIMFVMIPRAMAAWERIAEVLEARPTISDPSEPRRFERTGGQVTFEAVTFRYPGAEEPVLCEITLAANPGETTAIVGSTGSGKSTLINLIPRFYDVTGGRVLIDGVDIRDVPREELWKRIGFVPQKGFLFSGTVRSNLAYGKPDATDEEMWRALEVAQAADFVREMPNGLDTAISEGGTTVSGGQRQRLAIARALIKRPEIYVFDDSFSALDFATDARLRAALRKETRGATVIIVAQRVSTILDANRIVVLDAGRIVGIGTHQELLETCDAYQEIVESQIGLGEIA